MKKHTSGEWNWHGPYLGGGYKVSALNAEDAILMRDRRDLDRIYDKASDLFGDQ